MSSLALTVELPDSDLCLGSGSLRLDLAPRLSLAQLIEAAVRTHLAVRRATRPRAVTATRGGDVLDPLRLSMGMAMGKIATASRAERELQNADDADENVEIAKALAAFRKGGFQVVIDGTWYRNDLDAEVALQEDSTVLFLRLMPLVGG